MNLNAPPKATYLFVLPWPLDRLGGVNQVVINLAREMMKHTRLQPIVLINDWDAINPKTEVFQGLITVRWRIRTNPHYMSWKAFLAFWTWEFRFIRKFQNFCVENNVVAVNLHFPSLIAFSLDRVISKLSRQMCFILSFHGSDVDAIANADTVELVRWRHLLARKDCRIVVCSYDLAKRLESAVGCPLNTVVIHNGLDVKSFSAKGSVNRDMGEPELRVLCVGKFEDNKGQDVLIKAFSDILPKYKNLRLVLVGSSGKALPQLKSLCAKNEVSDRVEFNIDVPHEKIAEFYSRAAIFCLPSRNEAFGIVILEAASFSIPVVAARTGGIPEIIKEGKSGLLFKPGDHYDLASCLITLIDDSFSARKMADRLHHDIRLNFSWLVAYNKYIEILDYDDAS